MLANWEDIHSQGEQKLSKEIRKYFQGYIDRVLEAGGDQPVGLVAAAHLLQPEETAKLLDAVREPMLRLAATGASNVFKAKPKTRKDFDFRSFRLSQAVIDTIQATFVDLEKKSYWANIQAGSLTLVTDTVQQGIIDGLSARNLRKYLLKTFTDMSKARAGAIARTETTLAYNSGQQASYSELASNGDIEGKEWLSVSDDDTRQAHLEADHQIVGANEDFTIGGESAPYPGAAGLSVKQRVNCRCTTAAVFK